MLCTKDFLSKLKRLADQINCVFFSLQGLLKKHDAFEKDFEVHKERVKDIENVGQSLLAEVRSLWCNKFTFVFVLFCDTTVLFP